MRCTIAVDIGQSAVQISYIAPQQNGEGRNGEQKVNPKQRCGSGCRGFDRGQRIKDGFENAVKTYDRFLAFGTDNAETVLKSANAAGKSIETINREAFAYARKSFADGVSALKAVLSAKDLRRLAQ